MGNIFERNPLFNEFGIITGTSSATQFSTGTCQQARFKADPDNNDDFLIGDTISNNPLYPLAPGDDTGWFRTDNISKFVYSAISGSVDYLYYWLQR